MENDGMMKNRTDGGPREVGDVVSIIGPGMKVVGDCSSDGTIRIEGSVEGSVEAAKSVVVGKEGEVVGDIRTQDAIIASLGCLAEGTKLILASPMVRGRRGAHRDVFAAIRDAGLIRTRVDGKEYLLEEVPELAKLPAPSSA